MQILKYRSVLCIILWVSCILSFSAKAGPINIYKMSMYLNSNETGPDSLQDNLIGANFDTFTAGLDLTFSNGLDADNIGGVSWSLTNNTGADLTNVSLFGFLDADIDEATNTYFNEYGTTADLTLGGGSGDILADSFEIDEPGLLTGDIIDNLLAGFLDNTNALQPATADDASLALGFDIGTLLAGQSLIATFDISLTNNNGLGQVDPDSIFQFWFNGIAEVSTVNSPPLTPVPEPVSILLIGLGLVSLIITRLTRVRL